ncbi:molybdate ABC transporter substrate-binding protein [Hydrogenibacillus sp. N12]|uniref:molybdate ABC transporter substrate-binding protein n=1 Tax=Hydrogenibacillus sp. N12 TaxID=2866627 RepID=UPI001C7D793D|nr:molybdate ABC transporter substrate-binding protein [Hydrogenibacillus sp. N12]QZA33637.1 molybdate ABC transporter substrate-binding protein [Hydrogenibacillus sp. N12]
MMKTRSTPGWKPLRSKTLAWALVVLLFVGLMTACSSGNPAPSGGSGSGTADGSSGDPTATGTSQGAGTDAEKSRGRAGCKAASELIVSAAISLKDALTEYQPTFEQKECVKLRFNFGASGQLMQQIEQGAPVDVFISAGAKQVDELEQKGLIDPATRVDVVKNTLVMAVKKGTPEDLRLTFERLKTDQKAKLAIGEPKSVPAGTYAKEVLEHLGVYDEMEKAKRLVFGTDVRQVLAYVESGEVDGGLVYKTDAAISDRVEVSDTADPSWHRPIVYPGAVIKGSKHPDKAEAFIKALTEGDGRSVLERYGFVPGSP